MKNQKTNKM